jgi:hypothetical protein
VTTNPGTWKILATSASIVTDTHANRLANFLPTAQPLGLLFWETDRTSLYRVALVGGAKVWSYVLGRMQGTLTFDPTVAADDRPGDLGANDAGFRYDGVSLWADLRWDGAAWQFYHRFYPYRALVEHSVAQTIADATPTVLAFDTESFDKGGLHDNAVNNSRLTVPISGGGVGAFWWVGVNVEWEPDVGGSRTVNILRNGGIVHTERIDTTDTGQCIQSVTWLFCDAVGDLDYFEVSVEQDSGGAIDVTEARFQACRIGVSA